MARRGRYSRYDYGSQYPEYIPVSERQARNRKGLAALERKQGALHPVTVDGRDLAVTWWGRSWNRNLERYADYENRIGRGRSYVRHGAVLDLRIEPGTITALVQGSRPSPYTITVKIARLPDDRWRRICEQAANRIESMAELLAGQFPADLQEVFFAESTGLFPSPAEIEFDCSCPDWAAMCKHVAAVLYGVGNRLDSDPQLLFRLRQTKLEDLVAQTVAAATTDLLAKAGKAVGADVLQESDIGAVFGIDVTTTAAPAAPVATLAAPARPGAKPRRTTRTGPAQPPSPAPPAVPAPTARRKTVVGGRTPPPPAKSASSRSAKPARAAKVAPPLTPATVAAAAPPAGMTARLLTALRRVEGAFGLTTAVECLPEWTRLQVANTLQRAVAGGFVERLGQGHYRLADRP